MAARRRHTRGTALTETLVVSGILMLLWVASTHVRRGYAQRIAAHATVETRAWEQAFAPDCKRRAADHAHVEEHVIVPLPPTRWGGLQLQGQVSSSAYFPCNELP
jgi:hypothetical protein